MRVQIIANFNKHLRVMKIVVMGLSSSRQNTTEAEQTNLEGWRVVVVEWESGARFEAVLLVHLFLLAAQVVDFKSFGVVFPEELLHRLHRVTIAAFQSYRGESHGDQVVVLADIRQIQVERSCRGVGDHAKKLPNQPNECFQKN